MGRRKAKARRAPAAAGVPELRMRPQDRLGTPDEGPSRGKPTAGEGRSSEKGRPNRGRRWRGECSGRNKRTRGGSGGGRSGLRRLAYWALVIGLWGLIGGAGTLVWIGAHLPPIQSLEIPRRPPSIQIVGLEGHVLATRGEMGGAAVPLRELPPYLPKALIAIEDRRFYSHRGLDPIGVVRAVVANVLHRGVSQGGSTLTQQLAKNLFLTQERTMQRKLQEVVLALWLEHKFTKAQILEMYLNRVYFGSGAYGVEAASLRYFGKSARQVTLAEAALLAGLVKSPSRLAPTRNFDGAESRAKVVLAAMTDAGFIAGDAAKLAAVSPPHVVQVGGGSANYVADWVMDLLDDLIGRVEQDIVVETTIDPALQSAGERAIVEELAQKGDKFGVAQGALVAMTPAGAVRALVGGRDYGASQYNRAVAAKRQPGSAFKPFVYLTALERGLTPDTVRDDRPLEIKGWRPENYERRYLGPVTLSQALANSLNTVSVRLTLEVGPAAVVRTAHRLGITSKLESNASIALGTSEVSVLEMVSAFAPFANGGMAVTPHVVERVRGAAGKTLYVYADPNLGRIVEPRYVAMMNAMMQETLLSGTARKADVGGWPAAGKTGTSQDFRDAWFIGYTSRLVAGIWLGNDDGTPTRKTTGGGLPVEIWSRFMKAGLQGLPVAGLPGLSRDVPGFALPASIAAPMPRTADATARVAASDRSGIDGWLLDRVFGRH